MRTRTLARYALLALASTAVACTVHQTEAPSLTGPSEFALSVSVTALPDTINQDGGSQSSIRVIAHDATGQPKSGQSFRLDVMVSGTQVDFGTLSARTIVTGSDGAAFAIYTAPPAQPSGSVVATCSTFNTPGALAGQCVTITATPTGSNFVTSQTQGVEIHLVPPGIIVPPTQTQTPIASFLVTPTPVTVNTPVLFDASASCGGPLSSGACNTSTTITQYAWTFGDGTTAFGKTASHTYTTVGTFSATLTVTNSGGLSASTTQQVPVGAGTLALPTSNFTFSPAAPGVNETVFFNGSTSTAGTGHSLTSSSYLWTFGDGATAGGVLASHAYSLAGTYSVQLRVTDEIGQAVTSSAQSVGVGAPPAPASHFTFSPVAPPVGQQVVFDASTSTTAQGQTIVDVAWNFGDGTPVVHCPGDPSCVNVGVTNRISAHTFTFIGGFVVNLVVTDSAGRIGSSNQTITVSSPNPFPVLFLAKTGGNGIQADGSGSTSTGSSTITTYRFIWGDATPDTVGAASSVAHTYAAAGPHTVTLVVTDSLARTAATSKDITTP